MASPEPAPQGVTHLLPQGHGCPLPPPCHSSVAEHPAWQCAPNPMVFEGLEAWRVTDPSEHPSRDRSAWPHLTVGGTETRAGPASGTLSAERDTNVTKPALCRPGSWQHTSRGSGEEH